MISRCDGGIILHNLPFPPTVNNSYTGVLKRVSSDGLKKFKSEIDIWIMENRALIHQMTTDFLTQMADGKAIRISRFFFYRHDQVYTKKNTFKKNDVTNRIKAIDDAVVKILGVDDSLIWEGCEFKCITDCEPHVLIKLSAVNPVDRGYIVSEAWQKSK